MARRLWVLAASVFCWANGDDAEGGEGGLSCGDGGELPWKESTAAEMEQEDVVDSQGGGRDGRWVIYSASTPHLTWGEEDDEPFTVCSLDHVGVEVVWNSSQEIEKSALWELVLVHDDGREDVVVKDIAFPSKTAAEEIIDEDLIEIDDGKVTTISLQCEFDPDYCHPELVGIRFPELPDMESEAKSGEEKHVFPLNINDSIVLEFEAPTNRPEIASIDDVVAIVDFSEYVGDNLTGSWSMDGRILTLRVLDVDVSKLKPVQQFMDGLLETKLLASPSRESRNNRVNQVQHPLRRAEYALKLNFRIERPATYQVVIHDTLSVEAPLLISLPIRSPLLSISLCDKSDIILQDHSISSTLDSYHRVLFESNVISESTFPHITTPPSLFIPGILTAGGDEGFIVPESALHSVEDSNKGSWSMSFWLFLTEDSTGSFRTLFFHGDGGKEQRTPSVWWKPNERRLVLRVSTKNDPDVGLDSGQELPLREWVHLGFSFYNCSGARHEDLNGDLCPESLSHPQSWYYVIELYVNGELDQRVRVHEEVEANDGPLHIGKGPWTPGMQGFISDLRVYGTPLTQDQHLQAYLADMSAYPSYLTDEEGENDLPSLDQLSHTPASHIAYIFERIVTKQLDHSSSVDGETIQSLLSACGPGAIDELDELAERGHPLALFQLGKFHLYGVQSDSSSCNASTFSYDVDLDVNKAARFLFAALKRGHLESARYLALALEVAAAAFDNESSVDKHVMELANLKLGLYHVAASSGSKSSFAILGHLYSAGTESITPSQHAVAAHHYYHAARDASVAFHERGKQPLHEMNRLYDYRDSEGEEDLTARGERGDNDELIQYQKLRADQGDVESMAAMGDLYYWGARGVQRDHARAFHYFERAAYEGHPNSQCAVANMLLRGEGVKPSEQDNETAISWFNKAIEAENHTRALNGLGYLYFHGSAGLPENKTKALELFDRAANEQRDGDSLFNAGYCYARGIGTAGNRVNMTRAIELFDLAARKFGHFDSVMELADVWMHGIQLRFRGDSSEATAIDPDWTRALEYSKAASDVGRWGSKMRTGFSYYLSREWGRAIVQYHDALEFGGYPLASSNLAFLYDMLARKDAGSRKDVLPLLTQLQKERRAVKYLLLAHDINDDREVLVRLGDFYFHGLAGMEIDYHQALDWYSRASARGDDRAAYNVGYMYENGVGIGVNFARAKRYFERSRDLADEAGGGQIATIPARLAFYRVMLREWAQGSELVSLMLAWFSAQRKPSSDGYDTVVEASAVATATIAIIGLAVVARRHLRFL